jgi:hypothetical protein
MRQGGWDSRASSAYWSLASRAPATAAALFAKYGATPEIESICKRTPARSIAAKRTSRSAEGEGQSERRPGDVVDSMPPEASSRSRYSSEK